MAPTHAIPGSILTLPSDTDILLERSFRAPRALVWRAFTDPALLPKWMGPAEFSMTRCEMDVRPGGKFLWAWGDHQMPGEFKEVDAPRRLSYVDTGDTPSLVTVTFHEETDGRTKISFLARMSSKAARDEMLASGWTEGMDVCYAQLDALLPSLA
jgi:uncharacterized protein YndB with AHSA1/START domain